MSYDHNLINREEEKEYLIRFDTEVFSYHPQSLALLPS